MIELSEDQLADLWFATTLSQRQLGDIVGVSQGTVSKAVASANASANERANGSGPMTHDVEVLEPISQVAPEVGRCDADDCDTELHAANEVRYVKRDGEIELWCGVCVDEVAERPEGRP